MEGTMRKIQFGWAVLALITIGPFVAFGPESVVAFVGQSLFIVYIFFLVMAMVVGLLLFLLQLSDQVEALDAMGRVVVLITTALSVAALTIHVHSDKIVSADEVPASILLGIIFGSLLGLALCFVVRVFRKTPLGG